MPASPNEGHFFLTKDKTEIFIHEFEPRPDYASTIFIISGITGINHNAEADIIQQLSNGDNRLVVIHPRGTGYSSGKRGDIKDFDAFITDYIEVIRSDKDFNSKQHGVILYGHSMSTAVTLALSSAIGNLKGVILVNPPYRTKKAKGMSPSLGDYLKFVGYFLFDRHTPIVNMAGDPSQIENEEDRLEAESRAKDPLLVKYFSMYLMAKSGKLIGGMLDHCKTADYPLLLLYGLNDNIVDKAGCDIIYREWKCPIKQYNLIEAGSHGKSTARLARGIINDWVRERRD
ncbi:MAG: alpha/beta hydrolase [Bacteroidia bacterium]